MVMYYLSTVININYVKLLPTTPKLRNPYTLAPFLKPYTRDDKVGNNTKYAPTVIYEIQSSTTKI